jgi:hypothetical protein
VVVVAGKLHDQLGGGFGQPVAKDVVLGAKHLVHAVDGRGLVRRRLGRGPGAQHRHRTQRLGRRDRLGGGVHRQFAAIHFTEKKNCHQTAPASLSFDTSSSTEPTISPALRASGSVVFTISSRGVTSTP